MQLVMIQGARNLLGLGVGQGVSILAKARSSGPRARLQLAATSSPSRKLGCCRSMVLAMNFHGLRPAAWKQRKLFTFLQTQNCPTSIRPQACPPKSPPSSAHRGLTGKEDRETCKCLLHAHDSLSITGFDGHHGFRHRLVSRQPWNRNLMLHAQPLGPYRRKTSHYWSEVVDTSTRD